MLLTSLSSQVIKTWIIYGLSIGFELAAQNLFFRIGFLIAYILSVIFWLSGWAWAASWAGVFLTGYVGAGKNYGGALAGCAALGAIIWVLVIVNLVFFILACLRDDHSAGNVELGHQHQTAGKADAPQQPYGQQPQYAQQPQYGQPQQGYPQQQGYATQ